MSMIERVAEALAEADLFKWDTFDEIERQAYLGQAKAAIEAMREPTEAMFEGLDWPGHASAYYKTMISNALKEGVTR